MQITQARHARTGFGVAAAIVAATTFCGCTASPSPSSQTDKPLTKMEPPPTAVPTLTVSGHEISPASYDWIINGKPKKFLAAPNQDDVKLQHIPSTATNPTITLGSPVRPSQLVIAAFTSLDANGIPNSADEHQIDCTEPQDPCHISRTTTTLSLHPSLPAGTKIIVVHVGYWGDSPSDPGLALDSASWGVRLIPDR
ncbi:hypothetical protein IT072_20865 (plasmid) [Leifsonia sp. ZF2019]|uniref:hypothetical protein n=1 Tax=Leifsonia sp. ZF2019 TaxID=2781978 RepID=UPI001CBC2106|nr:hypothetical protein [Leifsonia sp. ZF2019]UAJ81713.1 hypothetical protein IT072_20865 [Leifsonia sp. ZF2019]